MLGTFGNLMGVILGLQHPLSTAYKAMWMVLQSGLQDDLHVAIDHSTYIKPVHVLHNIQLQFYSWFNHCCHRLTPPDPILSDIVNQIVMGMDRMPHLPPVLYNLAYPTCTIGRIHP